MLNDQAIANAMRIQTRTARRNRLAIGCCPLHGCKMDQIDLWYETAMGSYTFVGCMYLNCEIEAMVDDEFSNYELAEKWLYLLEQTDQGSACVIHFPSYEEREARVRKKMFH